MPRNIDIPWILQDHTGPSVRERARDKSAELRKRVSAKMGRVLADITFDKSAIAKDEYDEENPDKLFQDAAFATYEPNLRETHYRQQTEKHEYYSHLSKYHVRRLGSIAMMVPGMSFIGESISDARLSRSRQRDRRTAYKQRNGTFKSNFHDKYVDHKVQFSEERRVLDDEKQQLS